MLIIYPAWVFVNPCGEKKVNDLCNINIPAVATGREREYNNSTERIQRGHEKKGMRNMTWEVVAGLITLTSAGIGTGKIVYDLSRTLTKLNCSVENLNSTLTALTTENQEEHEELYGGVAELSDALQAQEIRIVRLEESVKD